MWRGCLIVASPRCAGAGTAPVVRGWKVRAVPPPKARPTRHLVETNTLWSIEVGRFHQFALAHRAITRAPDVVPSLVSTPVAIPSSEAAGGRVVFRPRIMGLGEAGARRSCDALQRRDSSCIPLPDRAGSIVQGSR